MTKFTELEKSILLAVYSVTKGISRSVKKDEIVMKFPGYQRKMVRVCVDDLVENKLMTKDNFENLKLTEEGIKKVSGILVQGIKTFR